MVSWYACTFIMYFYGVILFQLFQYWYREQEANFEQTKRKLQTELDSITFLKESIQRQKESLEGEVSAKTVEVAGLKSTVAELQTSQVGIGAQLDATKVCNCSMMYFGWRLNIVKKGKKKLLSNFSIMNLLIYFRDIAYIFSMSFPQLIILTNH